MINVVACYADLRVHGHGTRSTHALVSPLAQMKYLAPGTRLSAEEQGALRDTLCPGVAHEDLTLPSECFDCPSEWRMRT